MKHIKLFTGMILLLLLIITQTACKSEEPISKEGFYLDTICSVTIYHMDEASAQEAIDQAFALCKKYESILSKTTKGSDIYKINHADGKWVKVHPDTLKVVKKGLEYGKLSGGMFDITIGAVSDLWKFNEENPTVPDEKALRAALKTVDYRKVSISGSRISLEKKGAALDLGGIAKGYIADEMAACLKRAGADSAIINLGGNIVTIGEKEKDTPWSIGIERPYSDRSEILGSVEMQAGTIVTSGIYERNFTAKGKLYHHILNPKTGYPVNTDLEAVTIKGPSGHSMDCDALSTICLMLGRAKSTDLLKKIEGSPLEAAFVDKNDKLALTEGMVLQEP